MGRDKNLDTVRGVACVLLVLYHVVGANSESGLRLDPDSAYRLANEALGYVRMPLFTFLSGVVYALRPVRPDGGIRFAEGKLKRLLLPFVFISILFAVAQKVAPGTNAKLEWAEIPLVLLWPYAHLWFIAALLLVFALVGVLDYWRALDRPLAIVVFFAIACVLFELRYGAVGVFGWNRALYLLPFFVAGVTTKRFGWRWTLLCALLALASPRWNITLGVVTGLALLATVPAIPIMAWVGRFSYSIYLFHVFGTAGSRVVWERAGLTSLPFLIVSGTLAGLFVPIVIHRGMERIPFVSRALLGVRHKRGGDETDDIPGASTAAGASEPQVETGKART